MPRLKKCRISRLLLWVLALDMLVFPVVASAKPRLSGFSRVAAGLRTAPNANALPVLHDGLHENGEVDGVTSIDIEVEDGSASMEIQQAQENIVINWESFDIGENASVTFSQGGNTNWSALNRIWNANPSAIFGKLNADGRIFLINQNGMLFGPDSRVNVHTLVTTTMNMEDDVFLSGDWKRDAIDLVSENYQGLADEEWNELEREIVNGGAITADRSGAIFLAGPTVRNYGTLDAPSGQVALAAGTQARFFFKDPITGNVNQAERRVAVLADPGLVENGEGARISADYGKAGMYGSVVNQEGLITAVTAVEKNGVIELLATERVETGQYSEIFSDIADGDETYNETFEAQPGQITIGVLDTDADGYGDQTPESVVLKGTIRSPGGTVDVTAEEEVVLEETAAIDVSGIWSRRSASDNELEVQLNSVELSDSFYVRDGDIKGETIYVDALQGCSIAHINGQLSGQELTAQQSFAEGGEVNLTATQGSIRIDEGAEISFAGGGYHYGSGDVRMSYVRLGNQIFDVADVPDWALEQGDQLELLGDDEVRRLGLASVRTIQAYDEGHDAGQLTLTANQITLEGKLDGSATRGLYQTSYSADEPSETIGTLEYQTARGRRVPLAGSLILETPDLESGLDNIVVTGDNTNSQNGQTLLSAQILNAAKLQDISIRGGSITVDADAAIALATGGSFTANARNHIIHRGAVYAPGGEILLQTALTSNEPQGISSDEYIFLAGGSTLSTAGTQKDYSLAGASAAQNFGSDLLDGGKITIKGDPDTTGRIVISKDSVVDVRGGYAINPTGTEVVGGDAGTLEITGKAVVLEGDLRGHALVGNEGGTLTLHAGEINLHNNTADMPHTYGLDPETPLADEFADKLHISAEQIASSGFSHITLKSVYSPVLESGLNLTPSRVKYSLPLYLRRTLGPYYSVTPIYQAVNDDYLEASSLSIKANATLSGTFNSLFQLDAAITLDEDDILQVTPNGTISLDAPFLNINGTLTALGGEVSLTSSAEQVIKGGVMLGAEACINVQGYIHPISYDQIPGQAANYWAEDGGSVTLESIYGELAIENGACIDVSGTDPIINTYRLSTGETGYDVSVGEAGAISLTAKIFDIDIEGAEGMFMAETGMNGLKGGDLTLFFTDTQDPFLLDLALLQKWAAAGFDAMTLQSVSTIDLQHSEATDGETVELSLARQLEIDAPGISNSTGLSYHLDATYVRLINDIEKYKTIDDHRFISTVYREWDDLMHPGEGDAAAIGSISGQWLDMEGQIAIDGLTQLDLLFSRDIMLADLPGYFDRLSSETDYDNKWLGGLMTLADLNIQSDRLYPETQATYTIENGYLSGDQWLGGEYLALSGPADGGASRSESAIYSAGGTLILRSHSIESSDAHVIAPMGNIQLEGIGDGSRIHLTGETVLSAAGDVAVAYGFYSDGDWQAQVKYQDEESVYTENVTEALDHSVILKAGEVIGEEGTLIDVSGGGSIYAYEFTPSISGSADPLNVEDRYVILADNSVQRPGRGIYLQGVAGLADGWYSLLPESYAFAPGALILEDLGLYDPSNKLSSTPAGDAMAVGQMGYMGTGIASDDRHTYAVRSASEVLGEGQYYGAYIEVGDGGSFTARGSSTTLSSTILAHGLEGFSGGRAALSALNIYIGEDAAAGGLDPDNLLRLSGDFFSDAGFSNIELGYIGDGDDTFEEALAAFESATSDDFTLWSQQDNGGNPFETENIQIEEGLLVADSIGLFATNQILITENARIEADELLVATPGTVDLSVGNREGDDQSTVANIEVDRLGIFSGQYNLSNTPEIRSLLALGSAAPMALVRDAVNVGTDVMHLYEQVWNTFEEIPNVTLVGPAGITVYDGIDLNVQGNLEIHTPLLTAQSTEDGQDISGNDREAHWEANNVALFGMVASTEVEGSEAEDQNHLLHLEARDTLGVYGGDVGSDGTPTDVLRFDGINDLQLTAANDMIFGVGRMETGDSSLTMTAARTTTTYERDGNGDYQAADFTIDAGTGTVYTLAGSGTAGEWTTPGGSLTITADTIRHAGAIDLLGGQVTLAATGQQQDGYGEFESGLFLEEGAKIVARGGALSYEIAGETVIDAVSGGVVVLQSEGALSFADTAEIDVSNTISEDLSAEQITALDQETIQEWQDQGVLDAGTILIEAMRTDLSPSAEIGVQSPLSGKFKGMAGTIGGIQGQGGAFYMDAHRFDAQQVAGMLTADPLSVSGGFDRQIELRARSGDMTVGSENTLTAERIKLVADSGAITVGGTLDASGSSEDRIIALYARDAVNLLNGSRLDASGTDNADGGEIILSSSVDWVNMGSGSMIDVSGLDQGGSVTFIAQRFVSGDLNSVADDSNTNDVKLDLNGIIQGATRITAEAVVSHEATNNANVNTYMTETQEYMARAATNSVSANGARGRLLQNLTMQDADGNTVEDDQAKMDTLHLVPHLELYSSSSFALNQAWIFSGIEGSGASTTSNNDWRYVHGEDSEVGVLTVRSQGDLTVSADMADEAQDRVYLIFEPKKYDSWSFNLVAGADLTSADPMAVAGGSANLSILDNAQIYSESGTIRLAAANDIQIGRGKQSYGAVGDLTYIIATYDGDISADAGRDLVLAGQSNGGGSAIQSCMGDIQIDAGRNVKMNSGDAIRTLGKLSAGVTLDELRSDYSDSQWSRTWRFDFGESWEEGWETQYDPATGNTSFRNILNNVLSNTENHFWLYEEGGSVAVKAGRNISMSSYTTTGWMQLYRYNTEPEYGTTPDPEKYTASYTSTTDSGTFSGIGTMGGGDVVVESGRHINMPIGAFSTGDLTVHAGNNLNGRFLVNEGNGVLSAMGSFGKDNTQGKYATLELGRSNMDLTAQGDVFLGTILNPVYADSRFSDYMNIDYSEQSRVHVTAVGGNLTLSGKTAINYNGDEEQLKLLPPIVSLTAGRDVLITGDSFVMAPSSDGQLSITAGRHIQAEYDRQHYGIVMAAEAPEMYYTSYLRPEGYTKPESRPGQWQTQEFSEQYLKVFNEMWDSLEDEERDPYQAIYDRIVSDLALHEKDTAELGADGLKPVTIRAGEDIVNLRIDLPLVAEIIAGGDIVHLDFYGQNNNGADVDSGYIGDISSITAGGDILLGWPDELLYEPYYAQTGIVLRGPGYLMVSAGGSIDLGITQGILTTGQSGNNRLDSTGAALMLSAGYGTQTLQNATGEWDPQQVIDFYSDLRDAGLVYSALKQGISTDPYNLRYDDELDIWAPQTFSVDLVYVRSIVENNDWAAGLEVEDLLLGASEYSMIDEATRDDLAERVVAKIRENLIEPYFLPDNTLESLSAERQAPEMGIEFGDTLAKGAVSMVQSQIITKNGGAIYMMMQDALDVGLSAFGSEESKKQSGINTQLGGDIGIFARGDINVNESRIMTWYGGDAIVWTDRGSLNAGKGSKTAVSVASNSMYYDDQLEQYFPKNTPPAVGSGINLGTHDPDGIVGPKEEANPGNGYLFAPSGDIDAGEAGIAGLGLLIFEAQQVLNAQNIDAGAVSIGASAGTEADAGIGNLTGASSLSETSQMTDDASFMKSNQDRFKDMVQAMNDSLVPTWLAVEVTGFDVRGQEGDEEQSDGDENRCKGLTGEALQKCLGQ